VTSTTRSFGASERIVVLVAAIAGLTVGLLTYVVWPNVAYGFQLIAALVAIGLLVLGITLWRGRRLPASIFVATGAGLLLGIAIGYNVRPGASSSEDVAAIEVALSKPAVATLKTTSGHCVLHDAALMLLESGDAVALVDGRSVAVTLSRGPYRAFAGATGEGDLTVDVRVQSVLEDGSPTETWMGSDGTSTVTVTGSASEGTVDFSGLVLRPRSEQRDPIDVAGSISWICEPAS